MSAAAADPAPAAPPTPAYYPKGWDRERMLNCGAADDDLGSVTEDEMTVFREGLRADIGEEEYEKFFAEMYEREKRAKGIPDPPPSEPMFMQTMRLMEQRRGPDSRWDPWGFVVFKSPGIRDAAEWAACRERFDRILRESTDFYKGFEGLEECMSRMRFRWVEDVPEGDAGIDAIARRYAAMDLPIGLDHSLCLYITPASLRSILDSRLPSSGKRQYRKEIPYAVAVSLQAAEPLNLQDIEDDVAGASWRGWFNVALETLLESLFPSVASDSRGPFEIGGHVEGEDVWCDGYRWGLHKAGLGYWDRRTRQPGTGL